MNASPNTVSRPRVKICGITRESDARLAVDLGADALGLNFHRASPRAVEPARIKSLVGGLPAFVTVVGLFVDPVPQEVEAVLDSGLVQCLQFHGRESLDFCRSFRTPYIKAVRVSDLESASRDLAAFEGDCTVLLDAYVKGKPGGTGARFDWSIARTLVERSRTPIVLAGGLDAGNVALAIEQVRPYGVDVSSGVESAPGIKDADRMRQFFDAVSGAAQLRGS